MATKSKQAMRNRQHQKIVNRASVDGQCVWNALLAGVVGLERAGPSTHSTLLRTLRHRWAKSPPMAISVKWQGTFLTQQEIMECREALFQHIHIENGYCCGACDPLLIACAVAFSVNINHQFGSNSFTIEVDQPRRQIWLESSSAHMRHVSNQDIIIQQQRSPQRRAKSPPSEFVGDIADAMESCGEAVGAIACQCDGGNIRRSNKLRTRVASSKATSASTGTCGTSEPLTKLERRAAMRAAKFEQRNTRA